MTNFAWITRRLQAMSTAEIAWRFTQKLRGKYEVRRYRNRTDVTTRVFSRHLRFLSPSPDRLAICQSNTSFDLKAEIPLLGNWKYADFKTRWHAGFQTSMDWPDIMSHKIDYRGSNAVGDIRTNWELNRHFQFALLAKNYFASGDTQFLDELVLLFENWCQKNPFLWGPSWTSAMEIAIRASNWCYTYGFLALSKNVPPALLEKLRIGIINMTDYVVHHYSRYSSANNHLIVEAFAIGQSGILLKYEPWIALAVSMLDRELPLQNHADGVNREQALHYQSFYMEAMGMMMRLMQKNDIVVPAQWNEWLGKMSSYMSACFGEHGEQIEFGDDDNGKILDLSGHPSGNHCMYVLAMMSILLGKHYANADMNNETLCWLFTPEEIAASIQRPVEKPGNICHFPDGGITILRGWNSRSIIGIDHGPLGFGNLAAHGHADALSFQMYVDGRLFFADPGTYIYLFDASARKAYRSTAYHSTVSINGQNQSQMLGPFLWGKQATTTLNHFGCNDGTIQLSASHNGYSPECHERTFRLNDNSFVIEDRFITDAEKTAAFVLAPNIVPKAVKSGYLLQSGDTILKLTFESDTPLCIKLRNISFSEKYASQAVSAVIDVKTHGKWLTSKITLETD